MKKKILIGIMLLTTIAISGYFYLYKDHRDIASEKATFTVSVNQLVNEFLKDNALATKKYQDQTIEFNATITNIDKTNKSIVLDEKIFATFTTSISNEIVLGKKLKVKGRFLGYDELLEEFKIDQCTIK